MSIPYTKMHGCHNEYIYVDNLDLKLSELKDIDICSLARGVSNRTTGLGSDGLILLEPSDNPNCLARMRMYNADGSEGKMCGNGIRCITKLLKEKFGARDVYRIETRAGVKECFIVDDRDPQRFIVKVNMGRPSFLPTTIPVLFDDMMVLGEEFEIDKKTFKISCVSMGNPHCVIPVDSLETFDVARYGSQIEKHEVFPEGVNVEFIEIKNNEVFQRTWERGSGETQACGTGACAVGVVLILGGKKRTPITVHLRGGDLTIEWDGLKDVWMQGEAVTMGSGIFDISQFIEF